jgi:hypothetical protein
VKTCPVTGRVHRTARELAAELARVDGLLAAMRAVEAAYGTAFPDGLAAGQPLPDEVGDAWNAAHDAVAALERLRAHVEMNPRPMPAGAAGTWALIKQNID